MNDIAVLLLTAAVGVTAGRLLGVPSIPLLLFGGWVLSHAGLVMTEDALAKALELGLAFLVFSSGAELDPRRLKGRGKGVFAAAFVQMTLTGLLVFAVARLGGIIPREAAILAVALSASSTLVATRQLRRFGRTQEPYARHATGVLLAQDFLVVVFLAAFVAVDEGWTGVPVALGKAALLLVGAVGARRWLLPRLLSRVAMPEEFLLLFLLATLFVFLGAASLLGLPPAVGGFFAGIVFSRFPTSGLVRGQLASLTDFFTALFFVTLPQLFPLAGPGLVAQAVAFSVLLLVARPALTYVLARRCGLDSRASLEGGLLLAQSGEFALVVAVLTYRSEPFGAEVLALAGLVAALTMTVTPFVANDRLAARILHLRRDRGGGGGRNGDPASDGWSDHAVLVGYGAGGKWVRKPLEAAGVKVVVIDDDSAVVGRLREEGVTCLLGDGADPAMLAAANADRARVVLASPRRVSDALEVARRVQGAPVIVRVFEEREADEARRLGAIPVLNSHAAAAAFLDWFRKTDAGKADGPEPAGR